MPEYLKHVISAAGTLVAVTNTVATIPGIVVPIFVGALTHDNVSKTLLPGI